MLDGKHYGSLRLVLGHVTDSQNLGWDALRIPVFGVGMCCGSQKLCDGMRYGSQCLNVGTCYGS